MTPFTLRPLEGGDLAELWLLHSDPRAFELDTIPPLNAVDQMQRVLTTWLREQRASGYGYSAIVGVSGRLLGAIGVMRMPLSGRLVANCYVRLFPEAWGKGIARAALARVLEEHRRRIEAGLGYREVAFITGEGNLPARRLAEWAGFHLSGEQDPTESGAHVVYLLDASTWDGGLTGN